MKFAALAISAMLCVAPALALAADATPVGLWKNIDDETGKPKALIRITENNGVLQGQIEKLFREPNEDQAPKCEKCEGARKDQPIIGMVILTGLKKDGAEFTGGEIVDPKNGNVYKSKLSLSDGGKKISMRAYTGVPMLGRTQTWLREE
jgi:uncharacterized protein (DUF2147 family)